MDYAIDIERAADGIYSAHVSDVSGSVVCGDMRDVARTRVIAAVLLHVAPLRKHCEPAPNPAAITVMIRAV